MSTAQVVENYNRAESSMDDQYIVSLFLDRFLNGTKSIGINKGTPVFNLATMDPLLLATILSRSGNGAEIKTVFNSFNNALLSSLVPEIKLFSRTKGSKGYSFTPIRFQNTHYDLDPLKSPDRKNALLGLKDINIALRGKSPETARNDIDATVTFYGNNLSVFEKGEYLDLIIPQGAAGPLKQKELIMKIGWAQSSKNLGFTKIQRQAIQMQMQTFVMMYTGHSFNFNIDGSFTLSVNYVSMIDKQMASADFFCNSKAINAVYNAKGSTTDSRKRAAIYEYIEKNHPGASKASVDKIFSHLAKVGSSKFADVEAAYNEEIKKTINDLLKNVQFKTFTVPIYKINSQLIFSGAKRVLSKQGINPSAGNAKGLVSGVFADPENINTLKFSPNLNRSGVTQGEILSAFNSSLALPISVGLSADPKDHKFINVTTLGNLISGFIRANPDLSKSMKEKAIKIGFGAVKFRDVSSQNRKTRLIPLSTLPITSFLVNKVIQQIYVSKVKQKLTLANFLSALLNQVKKYFVQGDFVFDSARLLSANTLRSVHVVTKAGQLSKTSGMKTVRNVARDVDPGKVEQNYIICVGPSADDPGVDGYFDSYIAGSANSIVKRVNFTQANSATMAAQRDDNIVAAYRDGNSSVLPQLYNVDMEIIGNINFTPGYIFNLVPTVLGVNPNQSNNIMRKLGIMGKYMTISVEHIIGESGFTTKLQAINISSATTRIGASKGKSKTKASKKLKGTVEATLAGKAKSAETAPAETAPSSTESVSSEAPAESSEAPVESNPGALMSGGGGGGY